MLVSPNTCSLASGATLAAVGGLSKLYLNLLTSRSIIVNADRLARFVEERPREQSLITVANHYSCTDDPLLWAALPWRILLAKPYLMRWALAARDICFTQPSHSRFFGLGRCIPVDRGMGVYQDAVERCLDILNAGGWVHVFPEGRVNLSKQPMRLKWGVGRLIAECRHVPKVLPMYHLGFDDILPNQQPYVPRLGQRATLVIGDPIDVAPTVERLRSINADDVEKRLILTNLIQEKLRALKKVAEYWHGDMSSSSGMDDGSERR